MVERFNKLFYLSLLPAAVVLLISLAACSGVNNSSIPTMGELEPPPDEISIDKIYSDYLEDRESADSTYQGRRFLFTNVKAEEIESNFLNPRAVDNYVMADSVKFRARYASYLDGYKEGFVVDVVGVVQGMQIGDILVIKDCWFSVVEGDLAMTAPPAY